MELTKLTDLDFDHFCFDSSIRVYCQYKSKPKECKFYQNDYSGVALHINL